MPKTGAPPAAIFPDHINTLEAQHMTPIKAIRAHCIECCGGSKKEARLCPAEKCPLHPYRMGHRPKPGADAPADLEDDTDE